MKDVYLMNKATGEIKPSMQAIAKFYRVHDWNERWTDEWIETDLEVDGSDVPPPDFTKAINF